MIYDYLVGIFSSVSAAIITSLYYRAKYSISGTKRWGKLFRMSKKEALNIFYSNIQDSKYISPILELLQSVDVNGFDNVDTDSFLIVRDYFQRLVRSKIFWYKKEYTSIENLDGNIVSVSGPKWNKTTEHFIGKVGSPLYFSKDVKGVMEKGKSDQHENVYEFSIKKETNQIVVRDYGFILCSHGRKSGQSNQTVVLIAGYSTFGTYFAAKALDELDNKIISDIKKKVKLDQRFAVLIRGEMCLNQNGHSSGKPQISVEKIIHEDDFGDTRKYAY